MWSAAAQGDEISLCCSGMEARCCCFCKRRWADRRNYQRLFGTVSEPLRHAIVTNGTEIFAATVDLQEAFEESSVVCRECRQLFLNFEKKSQEMKALEESVRPLLLEALSRTESPAVSPIQQISAGHTRPPLVGTTSTPKRLRFQPEGGHEIVGQSPSVQVCACVRACVC